MELSEVWIYWFELVKTLEDNKTQTDCLKLKKTLIDPMDLSEVQDL